MTLAWRLQRRLANAAQRIRNSLEDVIGRMLPGEDREIFELRAFGLQLEFTNLCNANCLFCPYELQTRPHETMSDAVFEKAVADFVASGGGSVDTSRPNSGAWTCAVMRRAHGGGIVGNWFATRGR